MRGRKCDTAHQEKGWSLGFLVSYSGHRALSISTKKFPLGLQRLEMSVQKYVDSVWVSPGNLDVDWWIHQSLKHAKNEWSRQFVEFFYIHTVIGFIKNAPNVALPHVFSRQCAVAAVQLSAPSKGRHLWLHETTVFQSSEVLFYSAHSFSIRSLDVSDWRLAKHTTTVRWSGESMG